MADYAYETGQSAGQLAQLDPRAIYALESQITHPTHTDGLVDSGDPVLVGDLPGVCKTSAEASTDKCVIDTMGVYHLSVLRANDLGNTAIVFGDAIYINESCELSLKNGGRFYGHAAAPYVVGDGSAVVIPVLIGHAAGKTVVTVTTGPFAAADVAKSLFLADRPCRLISAIERHGTKAGQAGTLTVEKCATGEAATQGDVMLASAFDLAGDADTPVTKAAVADGKEILAAGDAIRMKLASGAATSLADMVITLTLELL